MNECLTTPQHKHKSAIGYQTNGIYIKRKKANVYKLNHGSAPDWTKYITKTVYKDWNCLEWFYSPYSNRKLNYKLTIFSIYYSCTLGEQSLKTRFQGEFCISHSEVGVSSLTM